METSVRPTRSATVSASTTPRRYTTEAFPTPRRLSHIMPQQHASRPSTPTPRRSQIPTPSPSNVSLSSSAGSTRKSLHKKKSLSLSHIPSPDRTAYPSPPSPSSSSSPVKPKSEQILRSFMATTTTTPPTKHRRRHSVQVSPAPAAASICSDALRERLERLLSATSPLITPKRRWFSSFSPPADEEPLPSLPITPPPTPPQHPHTLPRYPASLSVQSMPSSPRPFNPRTASLQCARMEGLVSFQSVEGLGFPADTDTETEEEEENTAAGRKWVFW